MGDWGTRRTMYPSSSVMLSFHAYIANIAYSVTPLSRLCKVVTSAFYNVLIVCTPARSPYELNKSREKYDIGYVVNVAATSTTFS